MRRAAARADRAYAVREEARAWRGAGAIDDATLQAIEREHPDDRQRLRAPLRITAGLAAFVAGGAVIGLVATATGAWNSHFGTTCLVLAAAFVVATEWQLGPARRAQAGIEYATGLLAAGCATFAMFDLIDSGDLALHGLACAAIWLAAAWRWGYGLFAVAAVACAAADSGHPFSEIVWAIVGVLAVPILLGPVRSARLAPSERRVLAWGSAAAVSVGFVGLVALVAPSPLIHALGWEQPAHAAPRVLALAVLVAAPVLALATAVKYRDRLLLVLGLLFVAGSAVTIRQIFHVVPAWVACLAGGVATLAVAILARRKLDGSPDREWRGLTADPLDSGGSRRAALAQAAATIAVLSPGARAAPADRFGGGGGASGGGGATGTV
jgi:hypothetical protein